MDQEGKRAKILKVSIAVILVLIHISLLVLFVVELDSIISFMNSFEDWVADQPVGGMLLIIVCYIFGIVLMCPTALFILTIGLQCHNLMGSWLGFFVGLTITFLCTICGCTLAFLFSRYLLKETILASIKPSWIKTRAVLRALEKKSFRIVFLFRLAPIFPFSLLNYALGASNISLKHYVLGSIGLLPKQSVFMYVAISVGSLSEAINKEESDTTQMIVILSIGAVLAIAAAAYLAVLAKREMKKILLESEPILPEKSQSIQTEN